jgi:hypothetical protein
MLKNVGEYAPGAWTVAVPEQAEEPAILRASIDMDSVWKSVLFLDERPEFYWKRLQFEGRSIDKGAGHAQLRSG